MSAQTNEMTVIQQNAISTVHLQAFLTPNIVLMGTVTWIIETHAMMTLRQTTNTVLSSTTASRLHSAQSAGMSVLYVMFPDWFGQYGGQLHGLKQGWWWSLQWKQGGIMKTRQSRTEWVKMLSLGFICCLIENFTQRNNLRESWAAPGEFLFISRGIMEELNHLPRITFSIGWEQPVQDDYRARICRRAESQYRCNATIE